MSVQNEFVTQELAPTEAAVVQDSAPADVPEVPVEQQDAPPAPEQTEILDSEPSGAEKRIKQLAAQKKAAFEAQRKAEAEAAYWKGRAEGGVKPEPQQPQQQQPNRPPRLDDFETFEAFEEAKDAYLIQKAQAEFAQRIAQQQQQAEESRRVHDFQRKIEQAIDADPDLGDIVRDETLPISRHMVPVLQESEAFPELLKYLHGNRKEANRIAQLSPVLAARELGIIEAKLKFTPAPTPPPKVSMAPEPIKTVVPAGKPIVDEDDLPLDEWIKRRNKAQFGR